jgi:RES domain-containing protein
MPVTAWRIVRTRYARTAFTGTGASSFGGRWNSPGVAVVYTAQSLSLAALEMLVHLDPEQLLESYRAIAVTFDEELARTLTREQLPRNWRSGRPPPRLQSIGNEWVKNNTSTVLRVPSVIIPEESNFLLNPAHPDFHRLTIGKPRRFQFDPRFAT